jgi:hypothetical protein
MQAGLQPERIECSAPVSFIHQTGDGPVHLLVKPSKPGWTALHWSNRGAGAWTFKTLAEANDSVLRLFQEMYDGHRCSPACRTVDTLDSHKSDDVWGMIRD